MATQVYYTVAALQQYLQPFKASNKGIGFVPTMGALHMGHISLVRQSIAHNDVTVVSIFVNPTQFNNPEDLAKYPNTLERDIELLREAGEVAVFAPNVAEMYPDEQSKTWGYELGYLNTVFEAAARPGHFNGVALIVKKLLDAVVPTHLYMGQKDYQQVLVVKQLINDFNMAVKLVVCPIVREADGLAMSSRNVRLSLSDRQAALNLSKALFHIAAGTNTTALGQLMQEAVDMLKAVPSIHLEYLAVANAETLQKVELTNDGTPKVLLLAATIGGVHLLDNMIIY